MRHVICLLALVTAAMAQPTIRVTTRLVDVSVIARDGHGPVADLLQSDFSVFDNGVEKPIAFFSVQSARPAGMRAAPPAANVFTNRTEGRDDAPGRLTVFVIDALNTDFGAQARVRKQLLQSVAEVRPRDRAAVWVMTDHLRRIQDFTNDPKALAAAVEKFTPSTWLSPEVANGAGHRAGSAAEAAADASANKADEMLQYYRMQLTNDLMKDLATALAQIPGRKNVVWLSAGFPLNLSTGPGGPDPTFVAGRLSGTGRAMAKGNVSVYPVDANGLAAPVGGAPVSSVSAREFQRHQTLDLLAEATGGRAFYDRNDLVKAVRDAVDDAEVTYTIGFYPGNEDGNYHRLKLEVKRAGVRLRYREGYVSSEPRISSTDIDGRDEIRNALWSPVDAAGLTLTARVEKRDPKRPDWLPMTIAIASKDLTLEAGELLDVVVAQHASDGRDLLTVRDTVQVDRKGQKGQALGDKSLVLTRQVQVAMGASKVRVVVYDRSSGRVGSLDFPVQ